MRKLDDRMKGGKERKSVKVSTLLQPAILLHLALLHDCKGLHETDPSVASQGKLRLYELNSSVVTKGNDSRAKYVKHP